MSHVLLVGWFILVECQFHKHRAFFCLLFSQCLENTALSRQLTWYLLFVMPMLYNYTLYNNIIMSIVFVKGLSFPAHLLCAVISHATYIHYSSQYCDKTSGRGKLRKMCRVRACCIRKLWLQDWDIAGHSRLAQQAGWYGPGVHFISFFLQYRTSAEGSVPLTFRVCHL